MGLQVTIHVRVPYRVVGLVVGPKGATIKRIQQDSSTYIVTPSRDREPVFEVTGSCEGVEKARRDIESYIALRTGTPALPESSAPPVPPAGSDVDPRVLLSSLLKSGGAQNNGCGGLSTTAAAAAALLSYNNAVNLGAGRLAAPPQPTNNDILSGGSFRPAAAVKPLTLHHQQLVGNGFPDNNGPPAARSSAFPPPAAASLFDHPHDVGAALRADLLDKALCNNNNNMDAWSAAAVCGGGGGGVDFTPLSLRSLASLLPLEDFGGGMKYPVGGELPASLESLVNYPHGGFTQGVGGGLLDATGRGHGDVGGGLCGGGGFAGSSDSGRSGSRSGSSPPASNGSPGADSSSLAASPRRLQMVSTVPPPSGCLCCLCTEAAVSAALVPCGHNLFCKTCADAVVTRPDPGERRCPVCGEQASLSIRILS